MDNKIIELVLRLGEILKQKKLTITTIESCTGGGISYYLTSVPGSSIWFKQSFVTYSNEAKEKLVNVSKEIIEQYGAVSEQVVKEMAFNGKQIAKSDLSVAVSGIAGPDGGTKEKPVGTVWIAICYGCQNTIWSKCYHFEHDRESIRLATIDTSIHKLLEFVNSV